MRLTLTASPQIEATEVTIGGEHFLLISRNALDGLFREVPDVPTVAPVAKPVAPKQPKATAKPKAVKASPVVAVAPVEPLRRGFLRERISELLRRKPMVSGEVVKAIPEAGIGSVYTELSAMRKEGLIVTTDDPGDGYRKNFLKEQAA